MVRVCVIGAGPSGIVTVKELLQENHDVECFEASSSIGGVFSPQGGKACRVYDRLRLTISSHYMAYSDYKPDDASRFWTSEEYFNYLISYAEHFQVLEKIFFNAFVISVQRKSEKWFVSVNINGSCVTKEYDAVAICTGTNQYPANFDHPTINEFQGKIVHSTEYSNCRVFEGKNVLVIGIGETAADIVRDVSSVAKKTHLLMRSHPFFVPRIVARTGVPVDAGTSRIRYIQNEDNIIVWFMALVYLAILFVFQIAGLFKFTWNEYPSNSEDSMGLKKGNFMDLDCRADEKVKDMIEKLNTEGGVTYLNKFATKNVSWMPSVIDGRTKMHVGEIDYFKKEGVVLKDSTYLSVDTIILCIGFKDNFNFVSEKYRPKDNNVRNLYRHAFHPSAEGTLCYVGWARPTTGAIPACSELIARVFASILSQKTTLPSNINNLIKEEKLCEELFFYKGPNVQALVNPTQYMDSLAQMIGAYVHPSSLLIYPFVFLKWQICTSLPARYRIVGPHSNKEKSFEWLQCAPAQFNLHWYVVMAAYKLIGCFGIVSGDFIYDYRRIFGNTKWLHE
eukprot:CAMPEP_0119125780 /NCGR_PEP_ID=MMETSP1310-20130426/4941_1 /TAXON_ID=464262 /ORGANISM="Genus nov. species nov., Strain RCC2339" /LENGTH=562 /DNA_ID=CAMNT_0007115887 /DNA_START=103 /DNA_END=1791 /DNA_ORIENTATION=+